MTCPGVFLGEQIASSRSKMGVVCQTVTSSTGCRGVSSRVFRSYKNQVFIFDLHVHLSGPTWMYFYPSSCRDFFRSIFLSSDVTIVFGARCYDCNHAHTVECVMPVESPSVVVNIVGRVLDKLSIKRRYISSLAKSRILIEHLHFLV